MLHTIAIPNFITVTIGFAVFLFGVRITKRFEILQRFNIPEPVTGGLLAALCFGGLAAVLGVTLTFETDSRDMFLVLFFAGIGLNARFADLISGGKPLAILLVLTVLTLIAQNLIGILGAMVFGFPLQAGILFGSAALIGGHGTAIAWSPIIAEQTGFAGAAELGVAVATIGLVIAALIGGPIARMLVNQYNLRPGRPEEVHSVGLPHDGAEDLPIDHISLMRVCLMLCLSVITGYALLQMITSLGLNLPFFVPCLIMGIVLGNLKTWLFPKAVAVSRTPTLALLNDFSLGIFLVISLMSLNLASLAGLGLPIIAILTVQTLFALAFVAFILFPALGRGYRAAVLAAGFGGFALGATPTAIANMTAVTKRYGPSPIAFIVLPLVSAFFVDLANAVVIQTIVNF